MNVYANTSFTGYWPVGSAACVVANTEEEAVDMLNEKLLSMGLSGDAKIKDMSRIDTDKKDVFILNDGNY